jgi:hypothetical protein
MGGALSGIGFSWLAPLLSLEVAATVRAKAGSAPAVSQHSAPATTTALAIPIRLPIDKAARAFTVSP